MPTESEKGRLDEIKKLGAAYNSLETPASSRTVKVEELQQEVANPQQHLEYAERQQQKLQEQVRKRLLGLF